jgi:hypothetical protein
MNIVGDAVARYHKILESASHRGLEWAEQIRERMQSEHLTFGGRVVCPFLRPNFITRRQYQTLVKATSALVSAIERVERMTLENSALMARMELLPAEKMLAAIDPGYSCRAISSILDTYVNNGSMQFVEHGADDFLGVAYGEGLSDLFYEAPPVKEFRQKRPLTKLGGKRFLLDALLDSYKEFGGKNRPTIAILECRQPFQTTSPSEYILLRDYFRKQGYPTEVLTPEQLEYRGGRLRKENLEIDLVYRQVHLRDFLLRYELSHPLVRAYRDKAVCLVNSFRSEMAHKKAILGLLTDASVTAKFPAEERKAIREYIPWTRMVKPTRTTFEDQNIDLPEFILRNRARLVLKPNDEGTELPNYYGSQLSDGNWDRAVRRALRSPYVVQEHVEPVHSVFPVFNYGDVQMKEMRVDLQPLAYLGKVQSASTWLTAVKNGTFSSLSGLAPTYIIESRS